MGATSSCTVSSASCPFAFDNASLVSRPLVFNLLHEDANHRANLRSEFRTLRDCFDDLIYTLILEVQFRGDESTRADATVLIRWRL